MTKKKSENNLPYLTVSEMAKKHSVSTQALRFYHRKGILMPQGRGDNEYRLYEYNQIYELDRICFLRAMDLSLDEIKGYSEMGDARERLEALRKHQEILSERIRRYRELLSILHDKIAFYEEMMEKADDRGDRMWVEHKGERYFVATGGEGEPLHFQFITRLPTVVFYKYEDGVFTSEKEFGALLKSRKIPFRTDSNLGIKTIGEGDWLCFYHTGEYYGIKDRLNKIIEEHPEIRVNGDALCINVLDPFIEVDTSKYSVFVEIPVEPSSEPYIFPRTSGGDGQI